MMRLIWLRGRRFRLSAGEARYYGWRLMVTAGPLTVLIGRSR